MKSKVSIIMATYNRANFIVEAILSIQAQTYLNWECLIIDDGGNDNTQEFISDVLQNDMRFRYEKRPDTYDKGLPGTRNFGIDKATGDYIVFFDDDDFVHPDNLKVSLEELIKNKVDYCHFQKVSYQIEKPILNKAVVKNIQILTVEDINKIITQEIGLTSCTVLWNKNCFDKIRFNEGLQYAEEWECYSRLISEGFKGVMIDTVLYYNRKHSESNTGEFYRNDPIRRESHVKAILLVFENLNKKDLLSNKLIHYFIQLSLSYKEHKVFSKLVTIVQFSILEKIKWQLFYYSLPLRLYGYRYWKQIKKIYS